MVRFEELQALWQNQPQPALDAVEAARLTRGLSTWRRRQLWVYGVKVVLVTAVIVRMMTRARSLPTIGITAAVAVVAAAMLFIDWRSRRTLARLDFSGASREFVAHAIAELEKQRDPFRKFYWPFLGTIALAENVCLAFADLRPLWVRLSLHAFGTVAPFLGYELGRRVRIRRFESECR